MTDLAVSEDILARARAAGCPVTHFEIAPPRPAGFYHGKAVEFRDGGPIWMNTLAQGFWLLTSYELVRDMYRNPAVFTSDSITPHEPNQAFKLIPTNINPPDHRKYRSFLNPWFTPRAVAAREDDIRETARRIVAELAGGDGQDVVQAFCLVLPTEVFLKVVGLPVEDAPQFVEWVEDFFRGFSGEEGMERGDGQQPKMAAATAAIIAYIDEVVADRRANPRDPEVDFFSDMVRQTIDDRPISDEELQSLGLLLVIAGLDTTRAHLGWLLYHLATHPEDRRRMATDEAIIPTAVEESLRYYSMIFGNGRKVGQDVEWHGVTLREGDMVFGLNTAANRDPKVFEDPDTFKIDRVIKHHVGFADGPHKCLGLHLARAEMRVAMEEWHKLIPEYELVEGVALSERGVELSLHSLPLTWTPRASA
jgi:cytochrome P450